ncbi:hypothetical protein RN001_011933 [Aquatica leii]|uniref:Lipase domain-containing protein n=1 Tax=Aquatica leii TaxID=1421715 RepID=A0AAN7P6L3_9COLE|nr:hypothetical protein RN001_011933 [Aquatica leii]
MFSCLFIIAFAGLVSTARNLKNQTEVKLDAFTIGNCTVYLGSDCPYSVVKYFFYTKNREQQVWLADNGNNLQQTFFNPNYETKIIIHGYSSNRSLKVLNDIKNEYFKRSNINIFMIDWEYLARGPCYPAAVLNCRITGKCVAKLIDAIRQISNSTVHVIGFSLGAHVSGFISHYVTDKVDRITGLDPALPGFATVSYNDKLDYSDAKFVDIIHTNAFFEGTPQQLGHVDFYANGGIFQPNCWEANEILSCSHHRAPAYFAESINSINGFWGSLCTSYVHYLVGLCVKTNIQILMGEDINQQIRGTYFVYTNDSPPYARGPNAQFFE